MDEEDTTREQEKEEDHENERQKKKHRRIRNEKSLDFYFWVLRGSYNLVHYKVFE